MELLRALSTFVRVVDLGSFSAVAREENTSHTAVTRLIGQMEDHFGVRLFQRTTRHLSLTEEGQDLLSHAHHVLEAASEMEGALGRNRAEPNGTVRVGVPVGVARLLVPALSVLAKRYPRLSVDLVVGDHFDDLVHDRLDLAVRTGAPGDTALISRAVGWFGRAAVASPAYLEQRGAPSHPDELAEHACIVHGIGGDGGLWRFTGPDGTIDVAVNGPLRANNSEVVRQAALAGLGVALLPEVQVVDDIRSSRLYRVLTQYPTERRQAFVVYPSRRHLPPRTRAVIDFLVTGFKDVEARMADERVWGESDTIWLV